MIKRLLEQFDDVEFESLKTELMELTDNNEHTQALLTIAQYFNLEHFIQYFKEIKEKQEKDNYKGLTLPETRARLAMSHRMYDTLKDQIGKEKTDELYACL